MRLSTMLLAAAGAAVTATPATAQVPPQHVMVAPAQVQWAEVPALPRGARIAVLEGPLDQPVPFTFRLHFADGVTIPPHFHPGIEHVTVLSGTLRIGMGDTFDAARMSSAGPGTFLMMPPKSPHFVQAVGDTVLQVHGNGPWGVTYVNPADDPRARR